MQLVKDVDRLERKLRDACTKEKNALRRLRLAQTLYDKHTDRRARLQDQIFEVQDEVNRVATRLTDKQQKEK